MLLYFDVKYVHHHSLHHCHPGLLERLLQEGILVLGRALEAFCALVWVAIGVESAMRVT